MSRIKEYVMDMNEEISEGKIIYETLYGTFEYEKSDIS
jgi:hypothetical protein